VAIYLLRERVAYLGVVLPEVSGEVLDVPLVESAGGVVVASPEAGGVVDASGVVVESEGMVDESAGALVLGDDVSDAGALGAVEFCLLQPAAITAMAPKQSRRTLRFMGEYLSMSSNEQKQRFPTADVPPSLYFEEPARLRWGTGILKC
jgi:hypothetical protein